LECEPDYLPLYEHFIDYEIVEAISGRRMKPIPSYLDPAYRKLRKEDKLWNIHILIDFYSKIGFDYVPFEASPKLPQRVERATEDLAIHKRSLRFYTDESRGLINSWDAFDAFEWPEKDEAIDYEWFELFERELPENMGVIGGVSGGFFERTIWAVGFVPFFRLLHTDLPFLRKIAEKICEVIFQVESELCKYDCIVAVRKGDDMGYKKGTLIPPKILREIFLPWHKKLVETAHKHDKPYILHSCGNLSAIIDDLINWVRIDAKHSFEDVIQPVSEFKEKYGDKVAVLGGVDVDKLSRYPPQEVKQYVKEIIGQCAPGGGYALGSGNSIANYIPVKNFLAMLSTWRKLREYPKRYL